MDEYDLTRNGSSTNSTITKKGCRFIPKERCRPILSLLFNLPGRARLLRFLLAGVLAHVVAGGRMPVPGAGRAPGAGFAGFRRGCEAGQRGVDVLEPAADPGGGAPAGRVIADYQAAARPAHRRPARRCAGAASGTARLLT